MSRTVNLVATREVVSTYFPAIAQSQSALRSSIISADFPIDPTKCQTQLGRWLAEHILTTRFDDDASRCRVLLPATAQGNAFKQFAETLSRKREVKNVAEAEKILESIEGWILEQRKHIYAYGETTCDYVVIQFQWPVYGSAAAGRLKGDISPEFYFDGCAGMIRETGGVILSAGLGGAMPPDSLLRTMATKAGGGLNLLGRYKEKLERSAV